MLRGPRLLAVVAALLLGCGDPTASDPPLTAPSELATRELASGDVEVSWRDNSDNETSFELVRSSNGPSGPFTPFASVAADVSTYQDTTVDGVGQYCYQVRAVGPAGTSPSPFSSPVCFQATAPNAPSELAATATFGQVDVTWIDNSDDETGFEIWRSSTGSSGTFTLVATVEAGVTTLGNTGLDAGAEYCYRVRAVGNGGRQSDFSNTDCATTPVPTVPPPAAPTALAATPSSHTAIALTWTDNAADEAGFEIWRSTTGAGGTYALGAGLGADATSSDDTGLEPVTEYCYQVRAVGGPSVPPSAFTNSSCATTLAPPPPAAPTGLSATPASATAIDLAWQDNATDEAAYEIWRSTTGASGTYSLLASPPADGESYGDQGLTPLTEYCYQVRAIGAGAAPASAFSNSDCATTPAPPPPATPTGLAATAISPTRINLAWQDNATDEGGYEIRRSTGGGTYTVLATLPADAASFSDTGLDPDTEYCYRVRATGAGGAPDSPLTPVTPESCATTAPPGVVRVVLFGDSNTDRCTGTAGAKSSYVSVDPALGPNAPHQACQVAGKIETEWGALPRSEVIEAVNHGISSTATGGGGFGWQDRTNQGSPNARTVVNGTTRFEAEVLGVGFPWSGGEPTNQYFPVGSVTRVNAFVPGPNDFVYVSMGTNDAETSRNMTAAQTETNLRWMIDQWTAAGKAADHFMLTTLPPRSGASSATAIPERNALIRALAADLGVHLIDIAAMTSDDDGETWRNASLHIGDGIHYTDAVRGLIADEVVSWMSATTPPE